MKHLMLHCTNDSEQRKEPYRGLTELRETIFTLTSLLHFEEERKGTDGLPSSYWSVPTAGDYMGQELSNNIQTEEGSNMPQCIISAKLTKKRKRTAVTSLPLPVAQVSFTL